MPVLCSRGKNVKLLVAGEHLIKKNLILSQKGA